MENIEPSLVWDEYKYRHSHIWQVLHRLVMAVVALGIIPYLDDSLITNLGFWIIVPPFLSLGLILFSMRRMKRELELLSKIKTIHRENQNSIRGGLHEVNDEGDFDLGDFDNDVWIFLNGILICSLINFLPALGLLCQQPFLAVG